MDGVTGASSCRNGRNADCSVLILRRLALQVDSRINSVVGQSAGSWDMLLRRKLDWVSQAGRSRNGVDKLALLGAGCGGHGERAGDGLVGLALLKVLLLGNGAGKRSCGRLRRRGRERVRWLIYDVLGQEDVVDNAIAIVLFGRALVDTPVAINDELRLYVSKRSDWWLPVAQLGDGCTSQGGRTLYCVLDLGSSTVFLKTLPSFSSWTVFFQSSKVPVT